MFRFPDIVAPCLGIHPVQGDPREKQRPANLEVTMFGLFLDNSLETF